MKHKHYDLIVQWASDPEAWVVESRNPPLEPWEQIPYPVWTEYLEYRLIPKRRMMHLNGVEFPAPEKEAPPVHTRYYIPTPIYEHDTAELFIWDDCLQDRTFLERGLVHLTREAAEAHARAMLAAKEVE